MIKKISLAKEAKPYLDELVKNAEKYNVLIKEVNEATIIDCGIETTGSLAAGMLFTKISMSGLAEVNLEFLNFNKLPLLAMRVETSHPVLTVLGSQAASWNISKDGFFGMVCGPGRALAQKPSKSFKLLEYEDNAEHAILCIESDKYPTEKVIDYIAEKCGVKKSNITILMIKTSCLVEYMQMAARTVELGIFRLVEQLEYPKERILHAIGTGIIAPLSDEDEISNDRVNNGLIYGTKLYLIIRSEKEDDIDSIINQLPSKASKNFGKKFIEVFNEADQDFSKFDLSLLAPTEVIINDTRTGKLYHEGQLNIEMIIN